MSATSETEESAYDEVDSDNADAPNSGQGRGADAQLDFPSRENGGPEPASGVTIRKRKSPKDPQHARPKRLKGVYRDEYRELFNSTIAETNASLPDGNPGRLEPSQIGASRWSIAEKQQLFGAIEKHGKDCVQHIAAIVKTKSEPEIREFLLLLQQGHVELHLNEINHRHPALYEIPAASELSDDCCKALEAAADALSKHQESWDAKQEQTRCGDYWCLTPELAAMFDEAVKNGNQPNDATDQEEGNGHSKPVETGEKTKEELNDNLKRARAALEAVPAARLLKLSSWFEILDRVFANAGGAREEENWRSIAGADEEPGIFHTAFTDFHRLVMSVTRRLVAASLIQATSRVRARDRKSSHSAKPHVRRQDVLAALDALDMPRSSRSFWAKAPRRCGVLVQLHGNDIGYDEVEQRLNEGKEPKPTLDDSINEQEPMPTNDVVLSTDIVQSATRDSSETESDHEPEDPELKQDAYAERFDMQESLQEEERLWRILGNNPPTSLASTKAKLPKRSPIERKSGQELVDWRDLVDFKAGWERFGEPVDEVEFERMALRASAARIGDAPSPSGETPRGDANRSDATEDAASFLSHSQDAQPSEAGTLPSDDAGMGGSAGSEVDEDENGGEQPNSLPIRRVLAPRRARDAATSSMGALPPYPEDAAASSEDDYAGGSNHGSD